MLCHRCRLTLTVLSSLTCQQAPERTCSIFKLRESRLVGYMVQVVLAARGYPGSYTKGTVIRNLDAVTTAKASRAYTSGLFMCIINL